ncbi:MAG: class I SAM-dependent methyltransferase [Chloroflexota bacterium]|nr:class I SAM-dependent methyltransferase [Chloroflexota bacterium]
MTPPAIPKYHLDGIFDAAAAHPYSAHTQLMAAVPRETRVLELGCASGYLSGYMEQRLGCQVTGVDFDPTATAIAAGRCSEVHTVDLDAPDALAGVSRAPYDVLLAAAVLEHLKQPERLLRDALALLKPGARVIVSLPNIAHYSVRLALLLGRFDYGEYGIMDRTHLHFYTMRTGAHLVTSSGAALDRTVIAGSGLQNLLNRTASGFGLGSVPLILPHLLAYELIYIAHLPSA